MTTTADIESPSAAPPPPPPGRFLGFSHHSWHRILREGGWVIAGQVCVAIVGLAGLRVLTHLAPRDIYAEANLYYGMVVLGRNIMVAPFSNAQIRFHPDYASRNQLTAFTAAMAGMIKRSSCLFAVLLVVGLVSYQSIFVGKLQYGIIAALLICLLSDSLRNSRVNWVQSERRQARVALWAFTDQFFAIVGSAVALLYQVSPEAYLLGLGGGQLLSTILFGYVFFPAVSSEQALPMTAPRREFMSEVFRYGIAFVPLAIVGWLTNLSDRYVLAGLMGKDTAGFYVAAFAIASRPIGMISGVLTTWIRPILFAAQGRGDDRAASKITILWAALMIGFSLVVICGFVFFGQYAALILDPKYRPGAPAVMTWVAIGFAIQNTSNVLENRLLSYRKAGRLILPSVAGASATILGAFLLIPHFGAVGAALSNPVGYGAALLMLMWVLSRVHREHDRKTQSPTGV